MITITNFKEFVNIVSDEDVKNDILLPLTHIPGSWDLPGIVSERFLKGSKGNKFYEDEELAFFTYGRNVYIPEAKKQLENDVLAPFVFVLDPDKIGHVPRRILPFDSGGLPYYKLPGLTHPKPFEIEEEKPTALKKLVFLLCKNSTNYLECKFDFEKLTKKYLFFTQLKMLHQLYFDQLNRNSDIGEQGRSFEVQYDKPVRLEPMLILYPHTYETQDRKDSQISEAFPGVKSISYLSNGNPRIYLQQINHLIKKYINNLKKEMPNLKK